jgi:hypothetical protein
MTSAELLVDAFGRIRQVVHRVVAALTPEQVAFRAGHVSQALSVAGCLDLAVAFTPGLHGQHLGVSREPLQRGKHVSYGHPPRAAIRAAWSVLSPAERPPRARFSETASREWPSRARFSETGGGMASLSQSGPPEVSDVLPGQVR